jgi:hypothetical protein
MSIIERVSSIRKRIVQNQNDGACDTIESCLCLAKDNQEYSLARTDTIQYFKELKRTLGGNEFDKYFFLDIPSDIWTETTNDNFIKCAIASFQKGKNINIMLASKVRLSTDNFYSIFVHELKKKVEEGSVSQLAIELLQLFFCLKDFYAFIEASYELSKESFLNHIVISRQTSSGKDEIPLESFVNALSCITKGVHIVLRGGKPYHKKPKKILILGRERIVYTVKVENGRTLKMVKYKKLLAPLNALKQIEREKKKEQRKKK